MGNFSRDPRSRLGDARSKHYVSVRMQQGVPIIDADLNELEDLRRIEFEDQGRWIVGNGVPLGNNGFRILAIGGGNVNTINLISKTIGPGVSKLKIDLATSSGAAALGFNVTNSSSQRSGGSPAQLTGNRAAPFPLANGNTLVIKADNNPPETITFFAAAFANIAAATAAEVIAVINAALNVSARASTGNDFIITGGDGTTEQAGRIIVDGQMIFNESDLKYSEQPLFKNNTLAQLWAVPVVEELTTPAVSETHVLYLDMWHRQVDSDEDVDLVDTRIGVESTVRLRREWTVRLAKANDFPAVQAARPPGHTFYRLAHVDRVGGQAAIENQMITDERETDLAVRREVLYRALDGTVAVNSEQLMARLKETRDNVRDFVQFLTTKFVTPSSTYVAGEVIGVETVTAIAVLAEHGIALLNTKALDTKGAIMLFGQIFDAEKRFIATWETAVLTIVKAAGKIYETAYKDTIAAIKRFVTGTAPIGFLSMEVALQRNNLFEALRTQAQINALFASEVDKPIGTLLLTYLGSTSVTVVKNVPLNLRYRITGSVTPRDELDFEVMMTGGGWQSTVKNSDGSTPPNIAFGPGTDSKEFVVTVQPPNLDVATTQINVRVSARDNSSGLTHSSTPKTLTVGQPPPPSEQDFAITVGTANVNLVGDAFQVPIALVSADITFRVFNNTNASVPVTLEFTPASAPGWNIVRDAFPLGGNIPALTFRPCLFQFDPPNLVDQELTFTFRAKNTTTSALIAETIIKLRTVS